MNTEQIIPISRKIHGYYNSLCEPILEEYNLLQISFDILMFLSSYPEHYTAKDICEMRGIKPNLISLHVDKLVNLGYLERTNVDGDRRKVKLTCTEEAEPVIQAGRAVQTQFFKTIMQGIPCEEIDRIFDALAAIEHNIDEAR